MSIVASQKKANQQIYFSTENVVQLPNYLDKVVAKLSLIAIYIFSKIKAFLSAVFYGKMNSWKAFCKNVNRRFHEISTDKKIKLYQSRKKTPQNSAFTAHVGYKIESENEIDSLKESNKNLSEYKEYKVKCTQQEMNKIKSFLEKISPKERKNASNILIDLNKFLSTENISKEIKDLIDRKLMQIPAYGKLKKQSDEKRRIEQIRRKRNNNLQTAAITSLAITITLGIGLAIYSYLNVAPKAIPINNTTLEKVKIGLKFLRAIGNAANG